MLLLLCRNRCVCYQDGGNNPRLVWSPFYPDTSITDKGAWLYIRQHVPSPCLCAAALHNHWGGVDGPLNTPQAWINNLIISMRKRCVAPHEASVTDLFPEPNPSTPLTAHLLLAFLYVYWNTASHFGHIIKVAGGLGIYWLITVMGTVHSCRHLYIICSQKQI